MYPVEQTFDTVPRALRFSVKSPSRGAGTLTLLEDAIVGVSHHPYLPNSEDGHEDVVQILLRDGTMLRVQETAEEILIKLGWSVIDET